MRLAAFGAAEVALELGAGTADTAETAVPRVLAVFCGEKKRG